MDDKDLFINLDNEELFQNNIESNEEDIEEEEDIENNKHITLKVIIAIIIITGILILIVKEINFNNKNYDTITNTNISYKCPEEYELINNKCRKTIYTSVNIEYYCDDGYNINKDNKCTKTEYSDYYITDWYCPEGYTLEKKEDSNLCYKTTTVSPETQYYCINGYTLLDNKCVLNTISSPSVEYICSAMPSLISYYDNSKGICIYSATTSCTYPAYVYQKINNNYVQCASKPQIIKSCPSGTEKINDNCISKQEYYAFSVELCPNADYEINESRTLCTKTEVTKPTHKIRCGENGYILQNNYCIKTITKDGNKKNYCTEGYELKDNKCIKYDIQEPIIIEE